MTEADFLAGKSENSLKENIYYWVPENAAGQNGPEWVTENGATFLSMKGGGKDAASDKTAIRAYRVFPVPPNAGSVTVRANVRAGYDEWADKSSRNSGCPYVGFLFAKGTEEAGYETMLFRRGNAPITPNEGMVAVNMAYGDKNWKTVTADEDVPKDAKILIVEIGVDSTSSLDLESLGVTFAKKYPLAPAATTEVAGSKTVSAESGQPQLVKLTESGFYNESKNNSLEENIYYWVPKNKGAEKGPEWVTENGTTFLSMKGGGENLIRRDYPEWASKPDKTFAALRGGRDSLANEERKMLASQNPEEAKKNFGNNEVDPVDRMNWGTDNRGAFRVMKNGGLKSDTEGTYVGVHRVFRVPEDALFVTVRAKIRADYNQWADKSETNGGPNMGFSFMKGAESTGGRMLLHRMSNRPETPCEKPAKDGRSIPAITYGDKDWATLAATASVPKGAKILVVDFGVNYAASLSLKSLDVTFEK